MQFLVEWHCRWRWFNTLKPEQNGQHFADAIFRCLSLNGNFSLQIPIQVRKIIEISIGTIQHCFKWWLGTQSLKLYLMASGPHKIGDFVYSCGGTFRNLLWSLGNSHGEGPRPSTKMFTESPCFFKWISAYHECPSVMQTYGILT